MRIHRYRLFTILILPLFTALACNLPGTLSGDSSAPSGHSIGGGPLNCDAFDVGAFNATVGGTFTLTEAKDDECSYSSDNGWALGIAVGPQRSEAEIRSMFETDAAIISDNVTWDTNEGFPLGIAIPRFGATALALGRSNSGYTLSILTTAPFEITEEGGPTPEIAQELTELMREAARQLNAQL